jgi:hypothetical protein
VHREGAAEPWPLLESIAATDVGRGSAWLAEAVPGGLPAGVDLLTTHDSPSLVVLTGFAIPTTDGWAAETDGPLGAFQLAELGRELGWQVRFLTDAACAGALSQAAPRGFPVDVAHLPDARHPHACDELIAHYRAIGVTHVVSIERVGPSPDGAPRNMRGEDVSAGTACLHHVAGAGPWSLVAVGDGGNEIGMGSVPPEVLERHVPLGSRVRCVVPADALIVAGTSNWGAAALFVGIAMRLNRPDLLERLTGAATFDALTRLVAAGAIDGVTRRNECSVDGLDWRSYQTVVDDLVAVARNAGRLT